MNLPNSFSTHIIRVPFDADLFALVYVVQHVIEQDSLLLNLFQLGLGLSFVIGLFLGFLFIG